LLGNDSPGLHLNHLQEAFLELQDKSVVLGPDFKGGTYLMGFSKISFNRSFPKLIGKRQKYLNNYEHFIRHKARDYRAFNRL
jgi:glycosyltransferase A (GT-A) superfamily protein (DUF2064 family)